jgi:hypothetical protein
MKAGTLGASANKKIGSGISTNHLGAEIVAATVAISIDYDMGYDRQGLQG